MKYLIAIFVLFSGSSALATNEDRQTCFRESSIRSWRALNNRTIDLWGRRGIRYRLDLWPCFDLPFSNRIAFRTFSGFDRVCWGDDVLVLDSFNNKIIDRCTIRSIQKMSN